MNDIKAGQNCRLNVLLVADDNTEGDDLDLYIKAIHEAGWVATLLCPLGPLAEYFKDVIEHSFVNDLIDDDDLFAQLSTYKDIDLVHVFSERTLPVGRCIAEYFCIPVIETAYSVKQAPKLTEHRTLCVSQFVRDELILRGMGNPQLIDVIPQSVESIIADASNSSYDRNTNMLTQLFSGFLLTEDRALISIVGNSPKNKHLMLEALKDLWEEQARRRTFNWRTLVVCGQDSEEVLMDAATTLNNIAGRTCVVFSGGQSDDDIPLILKEADLIVASETTVYSVLTFGKPVLAISNSEYYGMLNEKNWYEGDYKRFRSESKVSFNFKPGSLYEDIDAVIYNKNRLHELGNFVLAKAKTLTSRPAWNDWLTTHYSEIVKVGADLTLSETRLRRNNTFPLHFFVGDESVNLARQWSIGNAVSVELEQQLNQSLRLTFETEAGSSFYLKNGANGFSKPATGDSLWHCDAGHTYEFTGHLTVISGDVSVKAWLIEYYDERLSHKTEQVKEGAFSISYNIEEPGRSLRFALRFSGKGVVQLAPLILFSGPVARSKALVSPSSPARCTEVSDFSDYQGENLIFILGAPRSGTTWLLKVLSEHPAIVAATVDNLDARINTNETLETNVFTPSREFTDNAIKNRFLHLSLKNYGKIIVEKTPIHTLHHERIKRVFPNAVFVVIDREPRDIITSLLNVGRDKNAWWKGAPDTIEKATRLWLSYAKAISSCKKLYSPLCVQYEDMLSDARNVVRTLLESFQVDTQPLESMIEKSDKGENIDIPKVFRKGMQGGWKDYLTKEELAIFEEMGGDITRLRDTDPAG